MKKALFTLSLILTTSLFAFGQDTKHEFFFGYSNGQVDGSTGRFVQSRSSFGDTGALNFQGFEASGVFNISRYVGLKADVSGTYNSADFRYPITPTVDLVGHSKNSLYNILGGVQFKDNNTTRRFKPFAHALAGVGIVHTRVNAACDPPSPGTICGVFPTSGSESGFALALGGGIDVRLNDRFDLRVVQIDYNPVHVQSGTLQNARIGIGLVIK